MHSECALLQPEVKYLGHVVGQDEVVADPEKVPAVKDRTVSLNLQEFRAFFGLIAYYWQNIPDFAGIAQSLNHLTAKGVIGSGRIRSSKHLNTSRIT